MNETLIEIKKRINECFKCVRGNISMFELIEFEEYLNEQQLLIPSSERDYRNTDYQNLKMIQHRIELLKTILNFSKIEI